MKFRINYVYSNGDDVLENRPVRVRADNKGYALIKLEDKLYDIHGKGHLHVFDISVVDDLFDNLKQIMGL